MTVELPEGLDEERVEKAAETIGNAIGERIFNSNIPIGRGFIDAVKAGVRWRDENPKKRIGIYNSETGDLTILNYSGWISVKERLPEMHDPVLICGQGVEVVIAERCSVDRRCMWNPHNDWDPILRYEQVTHWMPLPLPPKITNSPHDKDPIK